MNRSRALAGWTATSLLLLAGALWATLAAPAGLDLWMLLAVWAPVILVAVVGFLSRLRPPDADYVPASRAANVQGYGILLVLLLGLDSYLVYGEAAFAPLAIAFGLVNLATGLVTDWSEIRDDPGWIRPFVKIAFFTLTGLCIVGSIFKPSLALMGFVFANQLTSFSFWRSPDATTRPIGPPESRSSEKFPSTR